MQQSNAGAAEVLRRHSCGSCTDVSGFGVAGHLAEMVHASGVRNISPCLCTLPSFPTSAGRKRDQALLSSQTPQADLQCASIVSPTSHLHASALAYISLRHESWLPVGCRCKPHWTSAPCPSSRAQGRVLEQASSAHCIRRTCRLRERSQTRRMQQPTRCGRCSLIRRQVRNCGQIMWNTGLGLWKSHGIEMHCRRHACVCDMWYNAALQGVACSRASRHQKRTTVSNHCRPLATARLLSLVTLQSLALMRLPPGYALAMYHPNRARRHD